MTIQELKQLKITISYDKTHSICDLFSDEELNDITEEGLLDYILDNIYEFVDDSDIAVILHK